MRVLGVGLAMLMSIGIIGVLLLGFSTLDTFAQDSEPAETVDEPAQETIEEPVEELVKETIEEPVEEPVKETIEEKNQLKKP